MESPDAGIDLYLFYWLIMMEFTGEGRACKSVGLTKTKMVLLTEQSLQVEKRRKNPWAASNLQT